MNGDECIRMREKKDEDENEDMIIPMDGMGWDERRMQSMAMGKAQLAAVQYCTVFYAGVE